jgi:hypothetical protein
VSKEQGASALWLRPRIHSQGDGVQSRANECTCRGRRGKGYDQCNTGYCEWCGLVQMRHHISRVARARAVRSDAVEKRFFYLPAESARATTAGMTTASDAAEVTPSKAMEARPSYFTQKAEFAAVKSCSDEAIITQCSAREGS